MNYKHKIFQNKHIWRQKRKGPSAIVQNGEEVEVKEYLTTRFAEGACRFMMQNEKNPFFLYVPFNAPHTPFQAPKSQYNKFAHVKHKNKRVYYAMIAALDDAIGKIMDQVKKSGIEENTLIFLLLHFLPATYHHHKIFRLMEWILFPIYPDRTPTHHMSIYSGVPILIKPYDMANGS